MDEISFYIFAESLIDRYSRGVAKTTRVKLTGANSGVIEAIFHIVFHILYLSLTTTRDQNFASLALTRSLNLKISCFRYIAMISP
jgi:hypothetical protein